MLCNIVDINLCSNFLVDQSQRVFSLLKFNANSACIHFVIQFLQFHKILIAVRIGYLYDSCSQILWKKFGTTLHGHDPSMEKSLASWSLDIHHTYHPDKGVVYLGGGGEMRLLEQPPMISTVLGDGQSRHVTCERCNGEQRPLFKTIHFISNCYHCLSIFKV